MHQKFVDYLQRKYLRHQAEALTPYLLNVKNVLDFGCGDLALAQLLSRRYPKLKITGVDVVDLNRKVLGIDFVHYDGNKLPFKNSSFDTVISYHVFHHCDDPKEKFLECVRVAKTRVVFVESVIRSRLDNLGIRITDWVFNSWREETIPMPYHFLSLLQWYRIFTQYGLTLEVEKKVGVLPSILPIGGTFLFSVKKGTNTKRV